MSRFCSFPGQAAAAGDAAGRGDTGQRGGAAESRRQADQSGAGLHGAGEETSAGTGSVSLSAQASLLKLQTCGPFRRNPVPTSFLSVDFPSISLSQDHNQGFGEPILEKVTGTPFLSSVSFIRVSQTVLGFHSSLPRGERARARTENDIKTNKQRHPSPSQVSDKNNKRRQQTKAAQTKQAFQAFQFAAFFKI